MYFGIAEHPRGFCYPFFMGEKPAREKGVLKSPQAFQNPKLKIIFPLMMRRVQRRRPPPAAETGRSRWGSGQQDASAAQGTMRMLGAATR